MGIQELETEKLNIINWISQLQDCSVVEKVKHFMLNQDECMLSDAQKNAIDVALASLETSETTPHKVVMEETKKRFSYLFNH